MRWTMVLVLVVTWLWGLVTGYTLEGRIHALPLVALVIALSGLPRVRRAG